MNISFNIIEKIIKNILNKYFKNKYGFFKLKNTSSSIVHILILLILKYNLPLSYIPKSIFITNFIAKENNLTLLLYLWDNDYPINLDVLYHLAYNKRIKCIKLLIDNGLEPSNQVIKGLIDGKHYDIIYNLHSSFYNYYKKDSYSSHLLIRALQSHNDTLFYFLINKNIPADSSTLSEAIKRKKKGIIKFLLNNKNIQINQYVISTAIEINSKELLKLLISNYNGNLSPYEFEIAIENENNEMIQYLIDKECPLDGYGINILIHKENYKLFDLLTKIYYDKITSYHYDEIFKMGDMKFFDRLVFNKINWDWEGFLISENIIKSIIKCKKFRNVDLLFHYIDDNVMEKFGIKSGEDIENLKNENIERFKIFLIKWVMKHGGQLTIDAFKSAIKLKYYNIINFLIKKNCEIDQNILGLSYIHNDKKTIIKLMDYCYDYSRIDFFYSLEDAIELDKIWIFNRAYERYKTEFNWTDTFCYTVIHKQNKSILNRFINLGMPLTKWASKAATEINNLELLKELKERNCIIDNYILYIAGRNGLTHIIKWIINNNIIENEVSEWIYSGIVNAGYIDCIKLVYYNYSPKINELKWELPEYI